MGAEHCRVRNYATGVNMCYGGGVSSTDACAEKTKEETQPYFQSSSGGRTHFNFREFQRFSGGNVNEERMGGGLGGR